LHGWDGAGFNMEKGAIVNQVHVVRNGAPLSAVEDHERFILRTANVEDFYGLVKD
jgi:hypothetical protein